jgi:hypothetical protein
MTINKRCGHDRPVCRTRSNSPPGRNRHTLVRAPAGRNQDSGTRASVISAQPDESGCSTLALFPINLLGALGLRGELFAPLGAASLYDLAAAFGGHAGAEPVRACAAALAGLERSNSHDASPQEWLYHKSMSGQIAPDMLIASLEADANYN